MPLLRSVAALLTCIFLVPVAAAQVPSLSGESLTFEHGGRTRDYYLYLPDDLPQPAPLVVVLHGRGGNMRGMAQLTGFDAVADAHGFAVVYPQGINNEWNYVEGIEGYELEVPDLAFVPALVEELVAGHVLDAERVYVTGFSNGGFMAQRLACEARDVFAAFASVGAAGYAGLPGVCGDPAPVSMLLMHGTDDAVIPFGGMMVQSPSGPVTMLATVQQTLSFWAAFSGCDSNATSRSVPERGRSPGTSVQVFSVTGCPEGYAVELVIIAGGGHAWPGHPGWIPADIEGRVNLDIDASEYIWEFFTGR